MSEQQGLPLIARADDDIDDCWNRIGVHGDKQCPLLERHIHCRNCEVHAAAATRLLDRYALQQDEQVEAVSVESKAAGRSMLLFRLGEEWLALAAEIEPLLPVHSLPHQRSRVLQGVANVRGALVPCLSFADLLGVAAVSGAERPGRIMPRMLILAAEGGPVVLPVDEVDGIHRLDLAQAQDERDAATFTLAVLQWRARSVPAVKRSLS